MFSCYLLFSICFGSPTPCHSTRVTPTPYTVQSGVASTKLSCLCPVYLVFSARRSIMCSHDACLVKYLRVCVMLILYPFAPFGAVCLAFSTLCVTYCLVFLFKNLRPLFRGFGDFIDFHLSASLQFRSILWIFRFQYSFVCSALPFLQ
jgi:hypothetical protein